MEKLWPPGQQTSSVDHGPHWSQGKPEASWEMREGGPAEARSRRRAPRLELAVKEGRRPGAPGAELSPWLLVCGCTGRLGAPAKCLESNSSLGCEMVQTRKCRAKGDHSQPLRQGPHPGLGRVPEQDTRGESAAGRTGPTPYAVPPGLFCFFLHGRQCCHLTSGPPDGDSRQADSLPLHHVGSPIYFEC